MFQSLLDSTSLTNVMLLVLFISMIIRASWSEKASMRAEENQNKIIELLKDIRGNTSA